MSDLLVETFGKAGVERRKRRKRRGGDAGAGGITIVTSPSSLSIADTASVGDVVGTIAVLGGTGSYTFTLTSNPGGLFSITGNQLKVAASLSAGTDPITIHADNGAGSTGDLATSVVVTHTVVPPAFIPTFELWGF